MKILWKIYWLFSPYAIRKRIVRKLVPKDLTVLCFDGMDEIGGSNVYDPATMEGWLAVKVQFWDRISEETEENGRLIVRYGKKNRSKDALTHRNSGK